MNKLASEYIYKTIRTISDFPKAGVTFRDITPVLQNPKSFRVLVNLFVDRYMNQNLDLIAGIDARGFILGSVLAYELHLGFIPIRKKGKLPYQTLTETYTLEYGNNEVEIHIDAVKQNQKVLLIDDLLATGGTILASIKLLQKLKANIIEVATIINLNDLGGAEKIKQTKIPLYSVCNF